MGPEGAVNIIFSKEIEAAGARRRREPSWSRGSASTINPYIAAGWA